MTGWLGLTGKVAVITGAGGGIGGAAAQQFAELGALTVLIDRDSDAARATAEKIAGTASLAPLALGVDVSSEAAVAEAARQVEARFGGADILVNTAAVLRPGGLDSLDLADWEQQLAINLSGCLLTSRAFGSQMRARGGGAIVHVASVSGTHPQAQSGAYSVSKAGLIMLSRQLAVEWGVHGIRSNVVSPGMVITPMSESFYAVEGVRSRREAVVPTRQIGMPDHMADAIMFLASSRACYISGEELVVDGGYSRMVMNLIPRPGYSERSGSEL